MTRSASSTRSSAAESPLARDIDDRAAQRAIYVHSPFCARRCPYCDFAISPLRERFPFDRFLLALDAELAAVASLPRPRTLYIGGGTPTALPPAELERFFRILARRIGFERLTEFTVEANPEDLDVDRARILASAGVNRVSLGAQSFDRATLRRLGRAHDATQIARSVELLRAAGIRAVNVDLIFAVPGQDLERLRRDVDACLALAPEHVSLYGLTFESGTAFTRARDAGRIHALDADIELELYRDALARLSAGGIHQYEVSNLARAGHRSRHNAVYWRNDSYLGFGPSAVSASRGVRWRNAPAVAEWARRVLGGESPVVESEQLSPERSLRETLVLGLRTRRGVRFSRLRRRYGALVDSIEAPPIAELVAGGFVERDSHRIRLTAAGLAVADTIGARLI